jgi:hypothetical protein
MWGVIYDAYYVAIRDEPDSEGQEIAWVEIRCVTHFADVKIHPWT